MIGSTIFYERKKKPFEAKLTLISLMDIFTILVFFLLMNSGDSETFETASFVKLPDSSSGITPHTEFQITISGDRILIGDKEIARVADVLASEKRVIASLEAELDLTTSHMGELSAYEKDAGMSITISGDRSVSYSLLKKVMTTCQQANYRNISLAVNQVGGGGPSEKTPDAAESSVAMNSLGVD